MINRERRIHRSPTMSGIRAPASSSRVSTQYATIKLQRYVRRLVQSNVSGEQGMIRFNHGIRRRSLAVLLACAGYASGLSATPLQLESTPLFLNVKAEPNVIFMIDDSGSMNWEVITADFSNDGRYTNIQRDGSASGSGQVVHRDNDDNGQPDCGFGS